MQDLKYVGLSLDNFVEETLQEATYSEKTDTNVFLSKLCSSKGHVSKLEQWHLIETTGKTFVDSS